MKILVVILGASLLFSACSSDPEASPDAKGTIAGDKAQIVEVLMLADSKGTAGEAFMEAAQDSSLAAKMRLALGITAEATKAGTSAARSRTTSKDGLDKANDALDNANQKLEKTGQVVTKTGQVIDKAGEIKKKTGDIFK